MSFSVLSLAQTNTATVDQRGTSQSANAVQTGNALQATIIQDQQRGQNVGNYAATVQTRTGNTAVVNQRNGSQSNRAGITQAGLGNTGVVNQRDNSGNGTAYWTARGFEIGGTPVAVTASTPQEIVMTAGGNWANLVQQGNNNTQTEIRQTNNSVANFAEILQYGNANRQTLIDQSNGAHINVASIHQGTVSAGVSGNQASISQPEGLESRAMITQLADNNTASVTQDNVYYTTALINQESHSNNNTAHITQKNESRYGYTSYTFGSISQLNGSTNNQASMLQAGVSSVAYITQSNFATTNQAAIDQVGIYEQATIDQSNAKDGRATISQNGIGDVAYTKQGAAESAVSTGNTVTITQISDYNTVRNQARLQQLGNFNQADITQTGSGVVQNASGLSGSFALQQGNTNTLTVLQGSEGAASNGLNVANVSQLGNSNTMIISQMGRQ